MEEEVAMKLSLSESWVGPWNRKTVLNGGLQIESVVQQSSCSHVNYEFRLCVTVRDDGTVEGLSEGCAGTLLFLQLFLKFQSISLSFKLTKKKS